MEISHSLLLLLPLTFPRLAPKTPYNSSCCGHYCPHKLRQQWEEVKEVITEWYSVIIIIYRDQTLSLSKLMQQIKQINWEKE